MPVWFVRWTDLPAAIADDVLTIDELRSLPSLLVESASFFEVLALPGLLYDRKALATARLRSSRWGL